MYGIRYERRKIARLKGMDYLWLGLVGQFAGFILIDAAPPDPTSAPVIAGEFALVLFTGILVGGCGKYARFYGLNRWWGLLGFLNVLGVLILILLPPRQGRATDSAGFSVIFAEPYRRDVWRMDVRVILDQTVGTAVREPIMLQLPRGANVGSAMKVLAGAIPGLFDGELPAARYSINGNPTDRRAELSDGDELFVRVIPENTAATSPLPAHG
ncbi:MAG: hypothetical protein ABSD28_10595 [Tepidisphaeraceae bacterium]|jgi:hypothetical protein